MNIQFATCDRKRALEFLQTEQDDLRDTPDSVGPLLDLVAEDVIRITDPGCHMLQIIQGKNWSVSRKAEVMAATSPIEHKQECKAEE